jgi:hypothetical protein
MLGFKYYASRAIVNGDAAKNGAMIAGYADAFEKALRQHHDHRGARRRDDNGYGRCEKRAADG